MNLCKGLHKYLGSSLSDYQRLINFEHSNTKLMKTNFKLGTAIAVSFGSLLCASAAYADGWPTSVQGSWSAVAAQSTGTLTITHPTSTLNCQPISGTLFGNSTIQGFYCPTSGRISFVRVYNQGIGNGGAAQYYQGNLSLTGSTLRIGGTQTTFDTAGGSLGEYNFSATK